MRAYQLPKGGSGIDALVKVERPSPKPAYRQVLVKVAACVYRKLDSAILVVKATENWVGRDGTEALGRAMERRVLVQGTMDPRLIIVDGICAQDPAQVRFAEYDHVVQALPAYHL
jgi:hypothetical protein